jgi:hypothetical protein
MPYILGEFMCAKCGGIADPAVLDPRGVRCEACASAHKGWKTRRKTSKASKKKINECARILAKAYRSGLCIGS